MKIVAPAGSIERFYAAISGGAQEIYMGIKGFGARRNAVNLTIQEYKEALDYAHLRGVKVFLTLNTIMMDAEIESIYHNVKELYKHGLDAIIVQDLGLAKFLKDNFPKIELHGSTQMTVANHIEANYLKTLGFTRVVLPREMTFEEIKSVREKTDIELEIFVSGALCISYSGNCYMSSFIGGRSGNRGMCAQPCRKKYSCGSKDLGYFLSPKDQMYGYEEIQKLKEIGVDSIKLEGRMKEPNYVYETVSYYKKLIDGEKTAERSSELFNRGYSKGYFYGNDENVMNRKFASNLGSSLGELKGNSLKLSKKIILGDGIIFLSKDYDKLGGTFINKIDTLKEKNKKFALEGEIILLKDIPKGTKYIHRNFAKEISDEVENNIKKFDGKNKIYFNFQGRLNHKIKIECWTYNNFNEEVIEVIESEELISLAKNKATTREVIEEKLLEIGDTTFVGKVKNIEVDENIFIPVSLLKQLKRDVVNKLAEKLILSYRRESQQEIIKLERKENESKEIEISAIVSNENQKEILEKFGIKKIYKDNFDIAKEGNLSKIDLENPLASNLYQILKNKNEKVIVDWNLNISNRYALEILSEIKQIETIIISPEISYKRLEEIGATKIRKAILGYSRPKGMYLELPLVKDREIITNEQNDNFILVRNDLGNTELYLEKPLNILKDKEKLGKIGIDEIVLEFSIESPEEIEDILRGKGTYKAYNYEKGVF